MGDTTELYPNVVCPSCGEIAKKTETRWGRRDSCCGLWSWHGKPLVDRETHDARQAAHDAFDPLWQEEELSRKEAYQLLAECLDLTKKQCHMALMDAETAWRVPAAVSAIRRAHVQTA